MGLRRGRALLGQDFSPKATQGSASSIAARWWTRTFHQWYRYTPAPTAISGAANWVTEPWTWGGLLKVARFGFGFFTGYHFYSERLTAFGCVQTATPVTPYICAPPIPDSTTVIRQNTTWHALRLGFNTEWKITPRWKLATDVAWLPIVHLSTWDTHLLRPDLVGSTPQSSVGFSSWQLEAILSYDFTNEWSVGLGHAIGNSILTRKCISKGVRAASHSQQLFKPSGGCIFSSQL